MQEYFELNRMNAGGRACWHIWYLAMRAAFMTKGPTLQASALKGTEIGFVIYAVRFPSISPPQNHNVSDAMSECSVLQRRLRHGTLIVASLRDRIDMAVHYWLKLGACRCLTLQQHSWCASQLVISLTATAARLVLV